METRMYVFIAFVVMVALRVIVRCYEDWRGKNGFILLRKLFLISFARP